MYAVVGCSECSALWIIEGRPETTECPRCGKRHQSKRLKRFVETENRTHAREVRASMLANRQGEGEAFAELDSVEEMENMIEDAGIDDEQYLSESGIDPAATDAAAERLVESATSPSRKAVVREALETLDRPTEGEVADYAAEHGVSEEYVEEALSKLLQRGEVSQHRGEYRLL